MDLRLTRFFNTHDDGARCYFNAYDDGARYFGTNARWRRTVLRGGLGFGYAAFGTLLHVLVLPR